MPERLTPLECARLHKWAALMPHSDIARLVLRLLAERGYSVRERPKPEACP